MKRFRSIQNISIVTIGLILTIVSSNLNWGKENWKGIIEADGKGYYAYLPAIFIYNDLNFGFFDHIEKEKYFDENFYYDYRIGANGKTINKYYCGTAVAQLPFFLFAHTISHVSNYDVDGYSKPYTILINIAGIVYLIIGLIFLNKTLLTYSIKEWQRSLVMFCTVFGTNLFYYSIIEPGLSHIYSFSFISIFIYLARRLILDKSAKYIVPIAATLGIIILIRPVNGLVLLSIPFLAGSFNPLKECFFFILKKKAPVIIGSLIFCCILFIQSVIYKISTGDFFVYSYGEETFDFGSPHIINILFSYKKGLFLYTPLYLLSFVGLIFLWKRSKFQFYSWLAFFFILSYILSSWWMWYYGGSFSSRVYVEYLPYFLILLSIGLNNIKSKWKKNSYISAIVVITILCQIQTYQYRYFQIHWCDMTKEKYWDVFLRLDKL